MEIKTLFLIDNFCINCLFITKKHFCQYLFLYFKVHGDFAIDYDTRITF